MIKISITDDHFVVLKGIESLLINEDSIDVISVNEDGKSTLESLDNNLPDLLLLDINLPDINGIELTKIISKKFPSVKIIALTKQKRQRTPLAKY